MSQATHDDSLTACDTCHEDIVAALSHINGTWQADTAVNTESRGLFDDYGDGSPGSCMNTGGVNEAGAAGCHDGAGEQGSWARRWTTTVTASDGTECANCHGTFADSFTFPTPSHNVAAMTDTTNHGNCSICHVYDDSAYTLPIGWGGGNQHGDDQLTMNSEPSVDYNQTTWSCDGGVCHGSVSPYALSDSAWAITLVAGPSASCTDCHGSAVNGNYWPDGSTADPANDEPGEHQVHFTRIAARQGYSTTTTSDTEQRVVCAYCHEDPSGADFNSGARLHNNGTANVDGYIHPIWQSYAADFATSDINAVFNSTDGSCATVDCHNNRSTSPSYDWNDTVSSACVMCHTDVTVDAPHSAHVGATTLFGVLIGCDTCHVDGVVWGTTAPASDHIYGSWTTEFDHAGNWGGVSYTGDWATGAAGSCGTNPCHNAGNNAAPVASAYTWGTGYTNCATCHESNMATLSHDGHLNAAGSFGRSAACGDCHGSETAGTHIDTQVTMASIAASYNGGVAVGDTNYGSCLTNDCHNDG
ncbi:MAG: hypothetical protein RQ723_13155, partial [Desulfuromonadales bacterium]|nr:hypothetical protein [Desulfuromonadales bacterium]